MGTSNTRWHSQSASAQGQRRRSPTSNAVVAIRPRRLATNVNDQGSIRSNVV